DRLDPCCRRRECPHRCLMPHQSLELLETIPPPPPSRTVHVDKCRPFHYSCLHTDPRRQPYLRLLLSNSQKAHLCSYCWERSCCVEPPLGPTIAPSQHALMN